MISFIDTLALTPLLIVLTGALLMLLVECFFQPIVAKKATFVLMIATLIAALGAVLYAPESSNPLLTSWLRFDSLAKLFNIFFLSIGLTAAFLAIPFFEKFETSRGEYFFLLLSAIFGLMLIGSAADFLTLFLGLETLSIPLYVLCGYIKKWDISREASLKYFLMGAMGAAFLLYGIALIYGAVGTTRFEYLLANYQAISNPAAQTLFLVGIALVTVSLAFKATIVPFHVWAPDVYDGAPTPVTAFMAVGTKTGAFAALAVLFLVTLPHFDMRWNQAMAFLAYPTLIYANFVAIRQIQMRRFFAYSGIAHAGYMLLPLIAQTDDALSALLFYLLVYGIATLGAFACISFLDQRKEGVMLYDLYGLFRRSPLLSFILSVCLLTLAGIPPTAGFFAKFYLFKIAFLAGYYPLVIVALLTSILAAFYYLRFISVMFSEKPAEVSDLPRLWPVALISLTVFIALIILSIYPTPFMQL